MSTQLTTTILRALGRLPRERETPVLVAVSGGPDSVALAHALHKLSVPIAIAHLDHRTRDGASGADAEFVREVADRLDVPFHLRSENVESDAEATNLSFEEYARERRYAFLIEAATTYGFPAIATGHHADDQAETLLMRVLRGTTPRGLAGIPETTERDGVAIVRPLLRVRRSAILAYLHERKITYIEDETNRELGFVRNRVRHALLPQLSREYNPRLTEALNRLADAQRAEDDLLRTLADRFIKRCVREERTIRTEAFAGGHLALQRRLVLEMAWRHGVRPDFDHVDRAIDFILNAQPRKSFDLGNGVQLVSGTGTVAVTPFRPRPSEMGEFTLRVPGEITLHGKRVAVSLLQKPPAEPLDVYCTPERQIVDADILGDEVVVRHRRDGDRFHPLGLGGTRKLKDYFCDRGVPPEARDGALILTARGAIVWIAGHAVSEVAAVTPSTTRWALLEVNDEAE